MPAKQTFQQSGDAPVLTMASLTAAHTTFVFAVCHFFWMLIFRPESSWVGVGSAVGLAAASRRNISTIKHCLKGLVGLI